MDDYLVHTIRQNAGIHFLYRVRAREKDAAFARLQKAGAIDVDEVHFETLLIPKDGEDYEMVAIVKENQTGELFEYGRR